MAIAKQWTSVPFYLVWALTTKCILAAPTSTESGSNEESLMTTPSLTSITKGIAELQTLNISDRSNDAFSDNLNETSPSGLLDDDSSTETTSDSTIAGSPDSEQNAMSQLPETASELVKETFTDDDRYSTTSSPMATLIRVLNALTDTGGPTSMDTVQQRSTTPTFKRATKSDDDGQEPGEAEEPPTTESSDATRESADSRQTSEIFTTSRLATTESSEADNDQTPTLQTENVEVSETSTEPDKQKSVESPNNETVLVLESRQNVDSVSISENSSSSPLADVQEFETTEGLPSASSDSTYSVLPIDSSTQVNEDTAESIGSTGIDQEQTESSIESRQVASESKNQLADLSSTVLPSSPESELQEPSLTSDPEDSQNPTSESATTENASESPTNDTSPLLVAEPNKERLINDTANLGNNTRQTTFTQANESITESDDVETMEVLTAEPEDSAEFLLNATDLDWREVLTTLESLNVSLNDIVMDITANGSKIQQPPKNSHMVLETKTPNQKTTTTTTTTTTTAASPTRSTSIPGDELFSDTPLDGLVNSTTIVALDLTTVASMINPQSTPGNVIWAAEPYQYYASKPKTSCTYNGQEYATGEHVSQFDPCQFCICVNGYLDCYWKNCPPPPEGCVELDFEGVCDRSLYLCPIPKRGEPLPFPVNSISKFRRDVGSNTKLICDILGVQYKVGELVGVASDPCLECRCAVDNLYCSPKCCFQPIATGSDPTKNSRANDALWRPILPHPLKHLRSEFENQ